MSTLDAIVKNAEDIAIQEGEEIIEEVIEEEQVEWMGTTEVMEQEQGGYYQSEELLEHQIVDYDDPDAYQSFLPVRDGEAYFSLNLPDLLSKNHQITQENGAIVRLISCFNKKCQRQVSCNGYLYTVKDWVSDTNWTNWRCIHDHCFGEIRTTPDFNGIREVQEHSSACPNLDELQITIRIAVYDARLLAEFTDTPLENLYIAAVERMKTECPEAVLLFPTYEVLKATLEDHRHNKIYRKRFEMQKFKDKQRKMNMTPDEVLYAENSTGMMKFRRTKPFPMSMCNFCHEQLISTNLPSQDQLIAHLLYNHGRKLTIERYEFKDVNLFDHYLRELNSNSKHKMKRMGLADENMYYLCIHDDRLAKTGVGRASRLQQQICHCTAFIRIFDWRIVSKREGARITIDYCLYHEPSRHDDLDDIHFVRHHRNPYPTSLIPSKEFIDIYNPEMFIHDLEERRMRSQKLLGDVVTVVATSERGQKRPIEMKTYMPPGRVKASFGTRALAPPLAAQLAAGSTQPFVDGYTDMDSSPNRNRSKYRQPIRNYQKVEEPSGTEPSQPSVPGPSTSGGSNRERNVDDPSIPPPRIYISQKPYTRLTERQNFRDIYTFNAVCKVEDACLQLLNRLQSCQHARIGLAYREKIATLVRNASTDPGLTDGTTPEEINRSWVLQRPVRGRPRKRARIDEGDEDRERVERDIDEDDMDSDADDDRRHVGEYEEENIEENLKELEDESEVKEKKQKETADEHEEEEELKVPTPLSSPKPSTSTPSASSAPSKSSAALPLPFEMPRLTREETNESTTSSSTSSSAVPTSDITTRSGRARKLPARLLED
ncbi:hypothetical protein CRE_13941 [Caenorhabditis remanei]|uniref:Uncharacterized protein n=1 Tax=Caenorhabditis remanei TaxID=31234 RepID=E3M8W2_CAERE|nr:hypothetical protein CRE_13941 [Caenorhabditis remanei]